MNPGSAIQIPDQFNEYSVDSFSIPAHYRQFIKSVLIPNGFLLDRVDKMAEEILSDLQPDSGDDGVCTLCVLKGAFTFYTDLMRAIDKCKSPTKSLKIMNHFIRAKSYVDCSSSGKLEITMMGDLQNAAQNKTLLIVEDIVDTGETLKNLIAELQKCQPKAIKVASLFLKRTPLHNGLVPDYVGFSIPNEFIIGYGLDYNEHYRDLKHVCIINEAGKAKFSSKAA